MRNAIYYVDDVKCIYFVSPLPISHNFL